METLAKKAAKIIEGYKNNEVIMAFVKKEALEKTASDIREKTGSGTTAKAVELLMLSNKVIETRVNDYIVIGLIGCFIAGQQ